MIEIIWFVGLLATFLLATVEHFQKMAWRAPLKMSAASAFVALGLLGNHETLAQKLILMGLFFGFIGDAALLSQKKKPFLLGIGAFLIGHALYAAAWFPHATLETFTQIPSILFILLALGFTPYIVRFAEGFMQKAVVAYILVITVMGITATAASHVSGDPRYVIGAAMFALSDVSVALDRFTPLPRWHRWLGIPLYFVSQYILASTLL